MKTNCQYGHDQFLAYLDEALNETEQAELATHLETCPDCAEELLSLQVLWTNLGNLPEAQPEPAVRDRFYTMLAAYEAGLARAKPHVPWTVRLNTWLGTWWPQRPAYQLAFVMSALVLGFVLRPVFSNNNETNLQIAQMQAEMQMTKQLFTVSLLRQQSASDRLLGIEYFSQTNPTPDILQAITERAKYDDNVNVRLAAIGALADHADKPDVSSSLVEALTREMYPLIQLEIINVLMEMDIEGATEVLEALQNKDTLDPAVQTRIAQALQNLE